MWFPAYLPHHGFDHKREFTLRSKLGTRLIRLIRLIEIHPAIGTLQQVMINVRAAIATFDFIIFGWRGDTGGHAKIVSNCQEKLLISTYEDNAEMDMVDPALCH